MGEKTYSIRNKHIRFSEDNDDYGCLCTFPHNDNEYLSLDRLKSLALFGAVVRLVMDGYYDDREDDGYIFIPQDVPEWILESVERTYQKV